MIIPAYRHVKAQVTRQPNSREIVTWKLSTIKIFMTNVTPNSSASVVRNFGGRPQNEPKQKEHIPPQPITVCSMPINTIRFRSDVESPPDQHSSSSEQCTRLILRKTSGYNIRGQICDVLQLVFFAQTRLAQPKQDALLFSENKDKLFMCSNSPSL